MFGAPIDLQFTASGHYCVDISGNSQPNSSEVQHVLAVVNPDLPQKEKEKIIRKLHRQFGHASAPKLQQLLQQAGSDDTTLLKMVDAVVKQCEICITHKRPSPKPVAGLPRATDYNHTVAMDLHQLDNGLWYLHIIDEFTRYSAGCITTTKKGEVIAKLFMKYWIAIHGPPKRIISDNGREFDNHHFQEMAEQFNITLTTTAAYSPWSNGVVERHNQTLTEMMTKVKKDKNVDWETALYWSLMAKNTLYNAQGFSPQQLVFSRNPNLPSTLVDHPPALEGTTTSQIVGKNINTLCSTRQAFLQAECSERIRRALRAQIRQTKHCEMGDRIYYKRPDSNEWRGPATVIGQDGVIVFARHGGMVVRIHTSRLTKFHETDNDEEERSEDDGIGNIQEELGNEDDENQESSDTENENQEPND